VRLINLTTFCEAVEISQAGSIPATVEKIDKQIGVDPVAWVEAFTSEGALFWRPLFTRGQVSLIQSVKVLESELQDFKELRVALARVSAK